MAQFITRTNNKFENKTTTEATPFLMSKEGKTRWFFNLRHISTPDIDDLVIDVRYLAPDWFFLTNGEMILNIDGIKNITLYPHESFHDVGQEQGAFERDSTTICEEDCYYNITKEEFAEICESKQLDIQVSGRSKKKTLNGNLFRLYCQAFYNYFYDGSKYKDALSEYTRFKNLWKKRLVTMWSIILALVIVFNLISYFVSQ